MMPAGKYYIGDLCYVMSDNEWEEFLSITIDGNSIKDGEFQFNDGRRFATYTTAWGDGLYNDHKKLYEFSVDAGLIGCIKVEDIKASKYDNIEDLGAIVEFISPFPTASRNGEIQFGGIFIDTDANYPEEDGEY